LTTAYELKKAGVQVQVLESENRVGGRIRAANGLFGSDGLVINAGAELVDSNHQEMINLVRELDVDLLGRSLPAGMTDVSYFFDGRVQGSFDFTRDLLSGNSRAIARLQQDREKLINARAAQTGGPEGITSPERHLDRMSAAAYLDSIGVDIKLRRYFEAAMQSELGRSLDEITSLLLLEYFKVSATAVDFLPDNDEAFRIKGGSAVVIQGLEQRLQDSVQKGCKVTEIHSEHINGPYTLVVQTPRGQQVMTTQHLVLALPFNALQSVKIDVPGLPASVTEAIQDTQYATNTKLTFFFERRIWNEMNHSGSVQGELAGVGRNGALGFQLWDSSQGQPGAHGALNFYIGEIIGAEDREKVVRAAMEALEKLFPGITATKRGHRFFSWRHSYSGAARPGERTRVLIDPRPTGNIHWVGEQFGGDSQGYMNGAVLSARRASRAIVAHASSCSAMLRSELSRLQSPVGRSRQP